MIRDKDIERLWDLFEDIPMDPKTECMEDDFIYFKFGTPREDIWRWFDEKHSRGVYYLLYVRG